MFQALDRLGHVDAIINDPEYELLFFLSLIASEVQNAFIYVQVFNSVFMVGCSYKFEFPTPDDRPGAPIISFR